LNEDKLWVPRCGNLPNPMFEVLTHFPFELGEK
jgi:hypothetical protein